MDRELTLTAVVCCLILVFVFTIGAIVGKNAVEDRYNKHCVAKYGDMPANKVAKYCEELLEFK